MAKGKRVLIVSDEVNFGCGVNAGIRAYCLEHGRWELHWEPDRHPNVVLRIGMAIKQWKAHGIIAQVRHVPLEKVLQDLRVPVVNISGAHIVDFPTVTSDPQAIGRMAARYFMDSGFRHFAYCALTGEWYVQRRGASFVEELAQGGFACDIFTDQVFPDAKQMDENWVLNGQRTDRWLRKLAKPVAIFCIYDQRAREIVMACHRLGLRVPDDVAVVGTGNCELICLASAPTLSSIDMDCPRIGFEAARLMDHLLHKGKAPDAPILIPPRGVVVRESSQWLPFDDPQVAAALRYIRDHLTEPLNVKELTRAAGITRWVLDTHFRKQLGRTLSQEVKRLRLEKARQLLEQTAMSVEAVARASGFEDPRILCRVFRAGLGLLPSQYRSKVQAKGLV